MAAKHSQERAKQCRVIREQALAALTPLKPKIHGDLDRCLPHVINFSLPELDSEAAMLALKGSIAISNGSACTSSSYTPSYVLKAMQLPEEEIQGALRMSWCHLTTPVDWQSIVKRLSLVLDNDE